MRQHEPGQGGLALHYLLFVSLHNNILFQGEAQHTAQEENLTRAVES